MLVTVSHTVGAGHVCRIQFWTFQTRTWVCLSPQHLDDLAVCTDAVMKKNKTDLLLMNQYENMVQRNKDEAPLGKSQNAWSTAKVAKRQEKRKKRKEKRKPLAALLLSIFPMHKSSPICNPCLSLATVLLLISMCCTFGMLSIFHLPFIPFTTSFVIGLA